ncbi:MAG: serpin family protein [Dehalococcoidia bacterium]|nr:serpin family protein [Dehalococcoidia bacterium]
MRGNNAFAFDLYHALSDGESNLFYSPFSISQALAMTSSGARGETQRQMADTLHHRLPQSGLHPAFNALERTLASRGEGPPGTPNDADGTGQYFRLNIANAVWGQEGYHFLPDFLDVLAEHYGAGMMAVDFVGAPDESRVRINDRVAEETSGKVKDLLPPGIIDRSTRLVLTNAVYFNASWLWPFSPRDTEIRPFHLDGGGMVMVPMMTETSKDFYGHATGDGYQVVDLPYSWGELSMTVLLPDHGALEEFEGSLDSEMLDRIIDDIEIDYITLTMPLFEFESEFDLGDTLAAMGMPDAFGARADFSGMTGSRDLWIRAVVHKAFVSVDEKGTEAAAATGVVMLESGISKEPIAVTVDRPFVFLIRDNGTGTALFLGRVSNPAPE